MPRRGAQGVSLQAQVARPADTGRGASSPRSTATRVSSAVRLGYRDCFSLAEMHSRKKSLVQRCQLPAGGLFLPLARVTKGHLLVGFQGHSRKGADTAGRCVLAALRFTRSCFLERGCDGRALQPL